MFTQHYFEHSIYISIDIILRLVQYNIVHITYSGYSIFEPAAISLKLLVQGVGNGIINSSYQFVIDR